MRNFCVCSSSVLHKKRATEKIMKTSMLQMRSIGLGEQQPTALQRGLAFCCVSALKPTLRLSELLSRGNGSFAQLQNATILVL